MIINENFLNNVEIEFIESVLLMKYMHGDVLKYVVSIDVAPILFPRISSSNNPLDDWSLLKSSSLVVPISTKYKLSIHLFSESKNLNNNSFKLAQAGQYSL